MCGIFCLISANSNNDESELINTYRPFAASISRRGPNYLNTAKLKLNNYDILLAAGVLWLQGRTPTLQPLTSPHSQLIFNGDIFGGTIPDQSRNEFGDTKLFLQQLETSSNIIQTLEQLEGPYSFVFINIREKKMYFARDGFGRRSLLLGRNRNGEYILSSVAKRNLKYDFIELPCIGVYCFDFDTKLFHLYPWRRKNNNFESQLELVRNSLNPAQLICEPTETVGQNNFLEPTNQDLALLETVKQLDKSESIFLTLLKDDKWSGNVRKLKELLEVAVEKRISSQPEFCQDCFPDINCRHALTGVLFSGGVDCAILALLADKFTSPGRPLDLINVAFERVPNYETPDRITGRETLKELQKLCPDRIWNFVEVNVTNDELNRARTESIADLIFPLNTILDDSLGCALWFASRAITENYKSPCRVLLVGMGADELFGGYTRHRAALQKQSWKGLHEVLEQDWQNLPHRNLARDDRVVSDHGRQLRTPYLAENLVRFVRNLNCWEKSWPLSGIPQGVGEKILLRTLAYQLGLENAATWKKRALQFGSRIANSKENAHEVSSRLLQN